MASLSEAFEIQKDTNKNYYPINNSDIITIKKRYTENEDVVYPMNDMGHFVIRNKNGNLINNVELYKAVNRFVHPIVSKNGFIHFTYLYSKIRTTLNINGKNITVDFSKLVYNL